MTENAKPSINQTEQNDLAGVFSAVLQQFLRKTDDMLPARVISFSRARARVRVEPLIQMVLTDGKTMKRPQIASLPVLQLGGGNAMISFNLVAGDYGWIKASDRDLSVFLRSMAETTPPTSRMHSFSDALFIPDVMHNFTIRSEDTSNMVIQNRSGTVRLALFPDRFKFTGLVTVEGDIKASGNISANRPMSEIVP